MKKLLALSTAMLIFGATVLPSPSYASDWLSEKSYEFGDGFIPTDITVFTSVNAPAYNLDQNLVSVLEPNSEVNVFAENENEYAILLDGDVAYVDKDLFTLEPKSSQAYTSVEKEVWVKIDAGFRYSESDQNPSMILSKGSKLKVIGENQGPYVLVDLDGNTGYVERSALGSGAPVEQKADRTNQKVGSQQTGPYKKYVISEKWKYDIIVATVRHEGGNSYDGALAVMSTILNRADSGKWGGKHDPYLITIAPGQFESYLKGRHKPFLGFNVSKEVLKGIEDALNGKRSHRFESFRTNSASVRSKYKGGIVIAGNYFF